MLLHRQISRPPSNPMLVHFCHQMIFVLMPYIYKIHAPAFAQSLYCLQAHKSRQRKFYQRYMRAQSNFHALAPSPPLQRAASSSSRATDWTVELIQKHLPVFMWHFDYDTSVPSRKQTRTKPNYFTSPTQENLPCWKFHLQRLSWVVDRRHCFFMDKAAKQEHYRGGVIL